MTKGDPIGRLFHWYTNSLDSIHLIPQNDFLIIFGLFGCGLSSLRYDIFNINKWTTSKCADTA